MADQNQNPLLPTLEEDEQFMSSENFSTAESALDWDTLLTRGNANNSQVAMSKWERDSLYVKFDPLVTSRKDPADRTSFVFKAPKPPEPLPQNKGDSFQFHRPSSGKVGNSSPPPRNVDSPPCIMENVECTSTPPPTGIAPNSPSLEQAFSRMTVSSPASNQDTVLTPPESGQNGDLHPSSPSCIVAQSAQQTLSPPQVARKSSTSLQVAASPSTPEQCQANSPNPQQMQTTPQSPYQVNGHSPSQIQEKTLQEIPPSPPTPTNATQPSTPKCVKRQSTPPQYKGNHSQSVADLSPSPEISQQSASEIFQENKKHKLKQLSKMELQLKENMEVFVKQKERYNKAVQEKDATMLERNEAQRELTNAEAQFADILMMYEQLKNVTTLVEKNCVILQKREEILVDTLQKRETREKASIDMYTEVMDRIKRDFENKIREKEAENVKLKAKIRMCEMKTTKLEGEIAQVDHESDSLRKLCEDLMKS